MDKSSKENSSAEEAPCFSTKDVEVLQVEQMYKSFFQVKAFQIRHRLFKGGVSKVLRRECFMRPPAVAVLPYDPYLDKVILIEQFRIGALDAPDGPWQWELVAGIREQDESAEDVAHREAIEEMGCELLDLEYICEYLPSAGGSNERVTLFCGGIDARGVGGVHGVAVEGEDIWVQVMAREEAFNAMDEGYIHHASAIIGLQWLQRNYHHLQAKWR